MPFFEAQGNTVLVTCSTTAQTPVQVTGGTNITLPCYMIQNAGAIDACIGIGTSPVLATGDAIVPTAASSSPSVVVRASSTIFLRAQPNAYFCGITSSAATPVYVTPGV